MTLTALITLLLYVAKIPLKSIATVLAADFAAGFIHWAEDAYGNADTPIVGKWIIQANLLHHKNPRAFVKKNWLQSNWDLALLALALLLVAGLTGHLTGPVILFALITANANEIHKWAHRTPRENGKIITFLQRAQIIQDTRHHARHHTNPKNSDYCTITNFLNPLLDGLHFWQACEFLLLHTLHLPRRPDPTVTPRRQLPGSKPI